MQTNSQPLCRSDLSSSVAVQGHMNWNALLHDPDLALAPVREPHHVKVILDKEFGDAFNTLCMIIDAGGGYTFWQVGQGGAGGRWGAQSAARHIQPHQTPLPSPHTSHLPTLPTLPHTPPDSPPPTCSSKTARP